MSPRILPRAFTTLIVSFFVTSAYAATVPPLKRVSLSSAGVGYFEHEVPVDGPTMLTLSIPYDQIDDVLKSLTIDGTDGAVSVRLPSSEPLDKSFRDFPFSSTALESPFRLLSALRGSAITIAGPRQIKGKLMAIEPETIKLDDQNNVMTRYRVSVITDEGLQQAVLSDIESLRFDDEKLREQLSRALDVVTSSYENGPRLVDIALSGKDKRTVRIGYVVSTPIWKVSYRLRLGTDDKARLQGWAVLENSSGQDWSNVELTLLSGNPVSFRQPLYQAYYTDRPVVPVETPNRLLPIIDKGEMLNQLRPVPAPLHQLPKGKMMDRANASNVTAQWMNSSEAEKLAGVDEAQPSPAEPSPAAQASESQTQIMLKLPSKQTITSGQSMMVPIIDQEVTAVRHTLLEGVRPVVAVEIANDTKTGLPPGAITFYDDTGTSSYLGDGRIGALPTGEKRLVGFAADLNVRIMRESPVTTERYSAVIADGVVQMKTTARQTTTYRMKSSAPEKRIVTIDYPRNSDETLVEPKEDNRDVTLILNGYRIRHPLAAGTEDKLNVVTESTRWQRLSFNDLQNFDRNYLDYYASVIQTSAIDEESKKIFQDIADIRKEAIDASENIDRLQEERDLIVSEQERLRQNLARVPSNSDLGKRYLKQMAQQEDKMETILKQVEDETAKRAHANATLRTYLNTISKTVQ